MKIFKYFIKDAILIKASSYEWMNNILIIKFIKIDQKAN